MSDWFGAETATLGDRLTGAREAAGLSQQELATRLGVRLETLASWEDDVADPRSNRLQMVAGMLNVSIMWLLTGEGEGLDGPVEPVAEEIRETVRETVAEIRAIRSVIDELDARLGRLERKLMTGDLG